MGSAEETLGSAPRWSFDFLWAAVAAAGMPSQQSRLTQPPLSPPRDFGRKEAQCTHDPAKEIPRKRLPQLGPGGEKPPFETRGGELIVG